MIRQASPFAVSRDELDDALTRAASFVAREYVEPTERPIMPRVPGSVFDAQIAAEPPPGGRPHADVSDEAQQFLARYTTRMLPAGLSAMVTTSPNPYALLADVLACGFNQHVARSDVAKFACRLEDRMIHWIASFIGFPAGGGTLTTGGAAANLIALAGGWT